MATQSLSRDHRDNAGYLERVLVSLRRSFFLSVSVLGTLIVGLGYVFEMLAVRGYPLENGTIAGMLGIWGATLLLVGGIGYGTLRHLRNY